MGPNDTYTTVFTLTEGDVFGDLPPFIRVNAQYRARPDGSTVRVILREPNPKQPPRWMCERWGGFTESHLYSPQAAPFLCSVLSESQRKLLCVGFRCISLSSYVAETIVNASATST